MIGFIAELIALSIELVLLTAPLDFFFLFVDVTIKLSMTESTHHTSPS